IVAATTNMVEGTSQAMDCTLAGVYLQKRTNFLVFHASPPPLALRLIATKRPATDGCRFTGQGKKTLPCSTCNKGWCCASVGRVLGPPEIPMLRQKIRDRAFQVRPGPARNLCPSLAFFPRNSRTGCNNRFSKKAR